MAQSWEPEDRRAVVGLLEDPARAAVAAAAAERVQPGPTVGLGSGRAVWATMELLARRADLTALRIVAASTATERLARDCGFTVVALDGDVRPALYIDGADEVAPDRSLLKGHGAALLREKLIAVASDRFVVVAEAAKRVRRLGEQRTLPVEVVGFGWADIRRRLRASFPEVSLRIDDGEPLRTDEGHLLLEIALPDDVDAATVAGRLDGTVGVVEHGLFLGLADEVLLGHPDGTVEVLGSARDGVATKRA